MQRARSEAEAEAELDPLHASRQDIATLLDAAYWRAAVPWLTVSRDSLRECEAQESGGGGAPTSAAAVAAAAAAAVAAAAAAAAVAAAAAAAVVLAPAAAILVPAAAVTFTCEHDDLQPYMAAKVQGLAPPE
jgi:hypothetical protein